jgi:hypothetical protein
MIKSFPALVLKRMFFRPHTLFTSVQAGRESLSPGRMETERVGTTSPLLLAHCWPLTVGLGTVSCGITRPTNRPLTLLRKSFRTILGDNLARYLEHPEEGRVASNETDTAGRSTCVERRKLQGVMVTCCCREWP